MSGISRGKPAPLLPIIGFARVEEGLVSFGPKHLNQLIPHSPSYCWRFSFPWHPCWSWNAAKNRLAHYGKPVWKGVALKNSAAWRKKKDIVCSPPQSSQSQADLHSLRTLHRIPPPPRVKASVMSSTQMTGRRRTICAWEKEKKLHECHTLCFIQAISLSLLLSLSLSLSVSFSVFAQNCSPLSPAVPGLTPASVPLLLNLDSIMTGRTWNIHPII